MSEMRMEAGTEGKAGMEDWEYLVVGDDGNVEVEGQGMCTGAFGTA